MLTTIQEACSYIAPKNAHQENQMLTLVPSCWLTLGMLISYTRGRWELCQTVFRKESPWTETSIAEIQHRTANALKLPTFSTGQPVPWKGWPPQAIRFAISYTLFDFFLNAIKLSANERGLFTPTHMENMGSHSYQQRYPNNLSQDRNSSYSDMIMQSICHRMQACWQSIR